MSNPLPPSGTPATPPEAKASASHWRRALRAMAWSIAGLIMAAGLLTAGAWWWLGSGESLAFVLARAARYLPAGQTLESRDVTGSVRAGGHIGWLRWQSDSLAVEVRDARIGWQLAPLLERKLQFSELHAAEVRIDRRQQAEDKPSALPDAIVLPVEVALPFRIDDLHWTGPPALQATHLAGSYRYAGAHHALDIDGIDIADGHYDAKIRLQDNAPMTVDAALNGRVRAPLAKDRSIDVLANATLKGSLAGSDARLAMSAQLKPVDDTADAPLRAQLKAELAPWRPQPLIDVQATLENVDVARMWPDAPATRLSGDINAGPDPSAGAQAWKADVDLRNTLPGPWDQRKLPLEAISAAVGFDGARWTVPHAALRAGGGRIDVEGRWSPAPAAWQAQATVHNVRPGALHTDLEGAPVSGRLEIEQRGDAMLFETALQAEGGAGAKGLQLQRLLAQGQWKDKVLDLRSIRVEAARASATGKLQLRTAEQAGSGELDVLLPGGKASVRGRIAPAAGHGDLQAQIDDASALQRWIESLPGLATAFEGTQVQGNARLGLSWDGGWQAVQRRLQSANEPPARGSIEPTIQATMSIPRLVLRPSSSPDAAPWQIADLRAELSGSLAQAALSLKGEATRGTRKLSLDTRASGSLERTNQWHATVASLRAQMQDGTRPPWTLDLSAPLGTTVHHIPGSNPRLEIEASAAAAELRGPAPGTVHFDWQPVHFSQSGPPGGRAYRVQTKGRIQNLPMAWAETLGGSSALADAGISGDLMFDGDWDIDAADVLKAQARLVRRSGDIRVQAGEAALVRRITSHGTGTASERTTDAAGDGPGTPAGLRQAELKLDAEGETVRASLAWDSERAGEIRAEASTHMTRHPSGWQWTPDAPLAGRIRARLPQLGVWSMLAPPGWRMAGTLEADATLSGQRSDPRWNGTLNADNLALRAPVEGLDLRDGRLRAALTGQRVEITEFTLKGGAGSQTRIPGQSGNLSTAASEAAREGGTLSGRGELSWGAAPSAGSGIRMDVQAQLTTLRLLVRADRQVTLSGDLRARLDDGRFSVRGDLKTDRGVVILPDETALGLGSDVVVRSAAKDREAEEQARRQEARNPPQLAQARTAKAPDVAVNLDLGRDFAVQGRGLTTRFEGKLDIRGTTLDAPPRISGEVRTVKGQYRAYGQQLDIETGVLRFNGPLDNPQLDILALRPNITQRAGVAITGTAQSPRVRLYSEPQLSEQETLSWVVLGRASATSGGESLLLQDAALALLGGLGKSGSGGSLASRFGLDEIGFKGPGSGGDVRASAVTVGKRFAKDFYLTYVGSLSGTLGTLFIFYDLTNRLTLRGQAGIQSGIDIIYTVQYD